MIVRRDDVDDLPRMVDGSGHPVGVAADEWWTIYLAVRPALPGPALRPRRGA